MCPGRPEGLHIHQAQLPSQPGCSHWYFWAQVSTHTCDAWFTAKIVQQQPSGRLGRAWVGGLLGTMLVECSLLTLSVLESSFVERAISFLSYVSASCKAGRLHEILVPTAESQLRVLAHAAYLICLNAKSFSSEAQCSFFPICLLSSLPTNKKISKASPAV